MRLACFLVWLCCLPQWAWCSPDAFPVADVQTWSVVLENAKMALKKGHDSVLASGSDRAAFLLLNFIFLGIVRPRVYLLGAVGLPGPFNLWWWYMMVMRWRCSMSPLCRCSFITTSFSQTNIHAYPWHLLQIWTGWCKECQIFPKEMLLPGGVSQMSSTRPAGQFSTFTQCHGLPRGNWIWTCRFYLTSWLEGRELPCFEMCSVLLLFVLKRRDVRTAGRGTAPGLGMMSITYQFLAVTKSHCVPKSTDHDMMWICSPCELDWNSFALIATDIDMSLVLWSFT